MAIDQWHRRLWACIHSKGGQLEHNLWTDDINFISICHFQCNFCMTVTVLYLWFKVCLQRRQLGLQACLFYKVVQQHNQGMVADFILRFGADICCLTRRKKIKISQQLPKLQQMLGHTFWLAVSCARYADDDDDVKIEKQTDIPNIANSGILVTILTKSFTRGNSLTTNIVGWSNKEDKFCHLVPITALLQQQISMLSNTTDKLTAKAIHTMVSTNTQC